MAIPLTPLCHPDLSVQIYEWIDYGVHGIPLFSAISVQPRSDNEYNPYKYLFQPVAGFQTEKNPCAMCGEMGYWRGLWCMYCESAMQRPQDAPLQPSPPFQSPLARTQPYLSHSEFMFMYYAK